MLANRKGSLKTTVTGQFNQTNNKCQQNPSDPKGKFMDDDVIETLGSIGSRVGYRGTFLKVVVLNQVGKEQA